MRWSQFFLPTLKENPKEAEIVSHRLMLRAGMVKQTSAGIYAWLPFGFKVLKKIEQIVREEQDKAGANELLMPTLQSADLWKQSGRYEAYGAEMLRITDRHDRDMLYGPTNEEMITDIFRSYCKSYKDVPALWYHIQWKFRDEIRPRFGVMRGREFLMKDCYSFDADYAGALYAYQKMFLAYLRTFARLGLRAIPMKADTGPIGGDLSHEFIVLADTGESGVFVDKKWMDLDITAPGVDYADRQGLANYFDEMINIYAATDEIHDPKTCALDAGDLIERRGIEVGHIFYFGDKYSAPFNAAVQDKDGQLNNVHMGSYGIGVSRLAGAMIEAFHDDKGIIWPTEMAPFDFGIINIKTGDAACDKISEDLLAKAKSNGFDPLYDDRDARAGAKFADMDLIGLPWQVIIGPKMAAQNRVEVKNRATGDVIEMAADDVLTFIAKH